MSLLCQKTEMLKIDFSNSSKPVVAFLNNCRAFLSFSSLTEAALHHRAAELHLVRLVCGSVQVAHVPNRVDNLGGWKLAKYIRLLLLLHEIMHLGVDPLDDGHQVVEDVFGVVHGGIHEVPGQEHKRKNTRIHSNELLEWSQLLHFDHFCLILEFLFFGTICYFFQKCILTFCLIAFFSICFFHSIFVLFLVYSFEYFVRFLQK